MAEAAAFDKASQRFIDHYGQVRGHVRSSVTRHNLTRHLPSGFLEVLDYQGGNGRDTIWIAGMGDEATLLEESPDMLKEAENNIKREKARIRRRINVVPGNMDSLDDDRLFDVIMSHGVLMYELEDPQGQLDWLAARLKERGILSLLTKGREAARRQVPGSSLEDFEATGLYVNRLNMPAKAYDFDQLEDMILRAGLQPIARYGTRLLSDDDNRGVEELPGSELDGIIAAEIEASQDPSRMGRAEMLHLIARKA